MRFFAHFASPAVASLTNITAVPEVDFDNTANQAEIRSETDDVTKLLGLMTVLCTLHETSQAMASNPLDNYFNSLTNICTLKSMANVANSLRRGRNPRIGSRALEQLLAMEGLQLGLPMLTHSGRALAAEGPKMAILGLGLQPVKVVGNFINMLWKAVTAVSGS